MTSSSWNWHPLGDFAHRMQYGLSTRGEREGRYPILRMNCLQDGKVVLRDLQFVDLDEDKANQFRVEPGDILFNRTNSYELVGRTGIVETDTDAVFASYLIRVSVDKSKVDPRFLNFFLNWDLTQQDMKRLASRGVGQANISAGKLRNFSIPVPPLDEQRAIASALGRVREAISLHHRVTTVAQDLKRVAMRALLTNGIRGEAQKETEFGSVPESWRVSTLGDVSKIERGRFLHRPRNEPRFYGGDTPFVQTGDVVRSDGRIREFTQSLNADGVAISRVFPAGTILITIAANIGYTGILQFDSACPDSLVAITPGENIITEFLEYWLQTQQPDMDRLAPKGTQKNINIQFLLPWPVVLPTLAEQREIVATLNVIDRKIDLHRRKRKVLDELFQSLLHKLMTGEARVTELDLSALAPTEAPEAAA